MRLKLKHMQRKSVEELEMGFNPINLNNIFEEEDLLNDWIDDDENSGWLPEELLNESDNEILPEGSEGVDVDQMSPISPNEESAHISTSSDDNDGNDHGGSGAAGMHQSQPSQRPSSPYVEDIGIGGFHNDTDPGVAESPSTQRKRGRRVKNINMLGGHYHDSFEDSSSNSVTASFNEYGFNDSSSQSSHSYQPEVSYGPYLGENARYEPHVLIRNPYPSIPTIDAPYGPIPPAPIYNAMPPLGNAVNYNYAYNIFPQGWNSGQSQESDENQGTSDPPRHSFWW